MGAVIPIIISILGLAYIISPIDFLPEVVLGPFGLADDLVVLLIVIASWLIYFALPILKILLYVAIGAGILIGLVYLLKSLLKPRRNYQ